MPAKVQTVLGPVDAADLGITFPHEHVSMNYECAFIPEKPERTERENSPLIMENMGYIRQHPYSNKSNLHIYEEEEAVLQSLRDFKMAGGGTVVENSTIGIRKDLDFVKRASRETNVNIVAGTGYYLDHSQTISTKRLTKEQMSKVMTTELTEGVDGVRCGVIGEIGCSWPITDFERRVLKATASVQEILGCPVIIHPGRHPDAPAEIVRVLQEAGADIGHTIMSHLDRTLVNNQQLLEFAATGAICELDLFGIEVSYYQMNTSFDMPSDATRIRSLKTLIDEGYADSITISHDIHTKHRLEKFGGHGYSHILRNVVPMMLTRGIPQADVNKILIETPARWLQFR